LQAAVQDERTSNPARSWCWTAKQVRRAPLFTERDVFEERVVGEQRDPTATPVVEVMTTEIACLARWTRPSRRPRGRDEEPPGFATLPLVDEPPPAARP